MRTSAIARLVVMGVLLVTLLVPLSMVQSVVSERASRRGSVVDEVSATWGGVQTIGGPVLMVPYRYPGPKPTEGRDCTWRKPSSPEALDIKGAMEPQLLERGLFEVVVYKAHLTITGRFARPDFTAIRPGPAEPVWDEATLSIGVADPRELRNGRAQMERRRRRAGARRREHGTARIRVCRRRPGSRRLADGARSPFRSTSM
jgi:inner membrane protein